MFGSNIKKRLTKLEEVLDTIIAELTTYKHIIENMDQKVKSLRGLVNRKLGYEDEEDPKNPKKNGIDDGLNELRQFNG